jgi:hypothetical protein
MLSFSMYARTYGYDGSGIESGLSVVACYRRFMTMSLGSVISSMA